MKKKYRIISIALLATVFVVGVIFYNTKPFSVPGVSQIASLLSSEDEVAVVVPDQVKVELLGRAEVSYAGGVINRNNNIELGIARINGSIIKPGEEFSFLKTLGPVLESDGFKEAKTFYMGEIVLGLGGGLCHVSTTLFQSVLNAGLPITERHNHTFSVPFYKAGLDATISSSGPDFKFKNDTKYDITIKGYTQDKVAIFEIYGVKDGRIPTVSDVEVINWKNPPTPKFSPSRQLAVGKRKCQQSAQGGYTARRIYEVLYPDGSTREQIFDSIYKPVQKQCSIGVDDATDFTGCTSDSIYSTKTGVKCPKE